MNQYNKNIINRIKRAEGQMRGILAMMEEKTKGNLTDDEKRLITHLIYELRLLYVKEAKAS